MPVTIKGIRLNDMQLKRQDDGSHRLEVASYSLISSVDKVLADQTIGGYNGMKLEPSPGTVKALSEFLKLYKADVVTALGLEDA